MSNQLEIKNERLRNENTRLRAALFNVEGDNQCWIPKTGTFQLPPRAEFMESCSRFHAQLASEHGVLSGCKTIAQLEQENATLRDYSDKHYADAMIAHHWFAKHFGEQMNGRDFAVKCQIAERAMKEEETLAAAAPELRDALEALLKSFGTQSGRDLLDTQKRARAALAKVAALAKETGRAPGVQD